MSKQRKDTFFISKHRHKLKLRDTNTFFAYFIRVLSATIDLPCTASKCVNPPQNIHCLKQH